MADAPADQEPHANEERLRLALNAGRLGLFDWDMASDRIVWSDLHYEILGYPPGDPAIVRYQHFAERIHPEDLPALEARLQESIRAGTQYRADSRVVLPDGTIRWISGTGHCLYDQDGRPYRMLGVIADITEKRRSEVERQQIESRLREHQNLESMGRMASCIAHDFNNILASITTLADLLRESLVPGDVCGELAEEIVASCMRGARLTRQLLTFSGIQRTSQETCVADDVIARMLGMLEALVGPRIQVTAQLDSRKAIVCVDRSGLEQLLLNLAVNARDAMPHGGSLSIRTEETNARRKGHPSEDSCK